MCGIIGILGKNEVAPQLVEALRRLEYRGYDSAGIATVDGMRLDRRRAVGKLVNLSDLLVHDPLRGKAGIGHTRWATHGAPTCDNAHPHRAGGVAVVHNGIVENFRELREELAADGYHPQSQTDTEVVALLTARELDRGASPRDAALSAIDRLEGAFALGFLFDAEPDLMIGARKGSPLAIGHGDGEMFLGSDAIALAPFTNRITYLEEGDRVILRREGAEILDASGRRANRAMARIDVGATLLDKGGFRHFMAKEIAEQPAVLADAIAHYLPDGLHLPLDFSDVDRLTLVACGTAHYACHVAKYWFEQIARLPVEIDIASEFRYRDPVLSPRQWAVFVSQSGETADTLAALRHASGKVGKTVAVVNVATSSIARDVDVALPILAGVEVGVASTKAFSCQLMVLLVMALKAAHDRGVLDDAALAAHLADIRALPGLMNQAMTVAQPVAALADDLAEAQDILFLGRGPIYPLALEGALKLKELSYIHAEGYASGELKHGPIALIDAHVPVIVLAPRDALFEKTVSNMQEVMARHGRVLLISDERGIREAGADCWRTIRMPEVPALLAPLLYAIPAQLLAYHTAIAKGTDVDQPRNLAKSVTVE
ncbi:glutamine--fructose-6-phosphate transaminase (isomerizing) [Falsirhodobacter algicola]|uniref:Glutamine--fructose-6-phosphate aminotransferase [isomerizing] n=1 Tax=Falsirhodobacter algicola TaxID=2692330 RepID=A0A8J8MSL0_9RHOB|nr:glutamine--fructose-6-phosphate transaminase (isomerizing) [Falsirhodobacter algicola]QUS35528.1 glutamine--fructose-6-phosphate transaminase (isomerizing) [Falsirhodobacter algicola]